MSPLKEHEHPDPVTINNQTYSVIKEGKASILSRHGRPPHQEKSSKPANNGLGDQSVFYNPIQQFNRDLSVLAILIYGEGAIVEKQQKFNKKGKGKQKLKSNPQRREASGTLDFSKDTTTVGLSAAQETPAIPSTTAPIGNTIVGNAVEGIDGNAQKGKKRKRDDSNQDEEDHDATSYAEQSAEQSPSKRLREDHISTDNGKAQELDADHQQSEAAASSLGGVRKESSGETANGRNGTTSEPNIKRKWPPFAILDALSASGLRAIRYAKEIPFASHVVANDLSHEAVKAIKLNVEYNEVDDVVESHVGDARAYMYSTIGNDNIPTRKSARKFDVVDLDPYGTAAPYFDAALQSLQDGGLLCVTCTDAGVFASNGYPEKAFGLYGGIPMKGPHSHEGGLRLILHAVSQAAAKYGIAIEPLLSLSIDFYVRLFIRVHKRQLEVKLLAGKTMLIYSCDSGCGSWTRQLIGKNSPQKDRTGNEYFKHGIPQAPSTTPYCEHCGFKTHLAGPMWAGPIHNVHFVQRLLNLLPSLDKDIYPTITRVEGMLTLALEEDLDLPTLSDSPSTLSPPTNDCTSSHTIPETLPSRIDPHPFFFILSYLCKIIHVSTPSEDQFRGVLRHLGYRVTRSHCKAGSIRTDAPFDVIWEIIREWARTRAPGKEGAVKPGTAGWGIMRRMRGTERERVDSMKRDMVGRLEKIETVEDLKREYEAALFRFRRNRDDGVGDDGQDGDNVDGRPKKLSKLDIVFDEKLSKERPRKGLVRYPMNPQPNWGPMNKAIGPSGG